MRDPDSAPRRRDRKRTFVILTFGGVFGYIAVWQTLAFSILVLLVWANEVIDFGHLLIDLPKRDFSWMRASLATGGVLLAAVIAVGNTYLQQQQIVRGLLTICSYCKKIRVDTEVWQRVETYISKRSSIEFSHGMCPDCFAREKQSLAEDAELMDAKSVPGR